MAVIQNPPLVSKRQQGEIDVDLKFKIVVGVVGSCRIVLALRGRKARMSEIFESLTTYFFADPLFEGYQPLQPDANVSPNTPSNGPICSLKPFFDSFLKHIATPVPSTHRSSLPTQRVTTPNRRFGVLGQRLSGHIRLPWSLFFFWVVLLSFVSSR